MGFLVLFIVVFTATAAVAAPFHVLIDPGHGGTDHGATRGKNREATIALNVAKKLADYLQADPRFRATLTREEDVTLSLPDRAQTSRNVRADLFLSIHANASTDKRAQGVEFYFQNQLAADEESLLLASLENQNLSSQAEAPEETVTHRGDIAHILEDLKRHHRIHLSYDLSRTLLWSWNQNHPSKHSRPIRQAPFYVVSEVNVPSVLVELGFVSNLVEGPKLASPEYQDQMAKSLFEGLVEFKAIYDRDRNKN